MRNKISLLILILLGVLTNAHAATYYVSKTGSNTTGNGTEGNPYYSLCGFTSCTTGMSPLSANGAIAPGDVVKFKRGDEWVGFDAQWTVNSSGSAALPITFETYGTAAFDANGNETNRPIFRGARIAGPGGEFLTTQTWTQHPSNPSIYYIGGVSTEPHTVFQENSINPTAGYFTANGGDLPLFGSLYTWGTRTNTNGFYAMNWDQSMVRGTHWYDFANDRVYVWRWDGLQPSAAAGRRVYIGLHPTDGDRLVKVWRGNTNAQNIVYKDLHVKGSMGYGFSASHENTSYTNCLSELNGMEGFLFDRRRFWSYPFTGTKPGAKNGVLRKCVARRNNVRAIGGAGQGITFEAENCWAYDTDSYENGWAGFDFLDYRVQSSSGGTISDNGTNTDGGGLQNCRAWNNGIHPVRQNCFDPNLYMDGASHITIRDSQFWGAGVDPRGSKTRTMSNPGIAFGVETCPWSNGRRPSDLKIVNCLSFGNMGPALNMGSANGDDFAGSGCTFNTDRTPSFSNIKVIGNTFHRNKDNNAIRGYSNEASIDDGIRTIRFTGITKFDKDGNNVGGLVFKNNIIITENLTRAPMITNFVSTANLSDKTIYDWDNNIWYAPGVNYNTTSSPGGFITIYPNHNTLATWRGFGQDTTFSTSLLSSNPLLVSTNVTDFKAYLQAGSPARDIASTAAYTLTGLTLEGTTNMTTSELDSPYNDLGYHYLVTGGGVVIPPPVPEGLGMRLENVNCENLRID